jgi:toxin ParE1/3/4
MSAHFVSQRARADIAQIWLFISNDRPGAADRLLDRFERHFELLADNLELGETCPHLLTDVRRSSVGNYIVLHRPRQDRVEILRVIHGARDVEAEFRKHWI